MAMNQSCYGVRGFPGYGDYFTYYTVLLRVADLQQRSHGSVFSTITRDTFRSISTAACPPYLSAKFDRTVHGEMSRIISNLQAISNLEKLRDTLLPKLLSGELRIPAAEKLVKEAMA
jgi:type I restriction enzyme S subunit